jgi:hypothetical protein
MLEEEALRVSFRSVVRDLECRICGYLVRNETGGFKSRRDNFGGEGDAVIFAVR